MFRGEVSDLSKDPMVETRAQLDTKDSPSLGPANAPVTLVEFSDFECPVCRALHDALRGMLPNYPQLRVVFKDFPLEQIHPWGGRQPWPGGALTSRTLLHSGKCMTSSTTGADGAAERLGLKRTTLNSMLKSWASSGETNLVPRRNLVSSLCDRAHIQNFNLTPIHRISAPV